MSDWRRVTDVDECQLTLVDEQGRAEGRIVMNGKEIGNIDGRLVENVSTDF